MRLYRSSVTGNIYTLGERIKNTVDMFYAINVRTHDLWRVNAADLIFIQP